MSDLTGEYRFRNEGDLLVLQVCDYTQKVADDFIGLEGVEIWRDAKTEDLLNIEFNRSKDKMPELFRIPGTTNCGHRHKEN